MMTKSKQQIEKLRKIIESGFASRRVLKFLTRSSLKFQQVRASFRVKRFDCVTSSKSLLHDHLIEEPTSESSEFVTQAFEVLISGN